MTNKLQIHPLSVFAIKQKTAFCCQKHTKLRHSEHLLNFVTYINVHYYEGNLKTQKTSHATGTKALGFISNL